MGLRWTVYCHTHSSSGRRYVGLTKKTLLQRWNQHVYTAWKTKPGRGLSHFCNAIRAYGKDAFSHEVLEVCTDLEAANLAEDCWIEFYDTRNPEKGFNVAKGGKHVPHPVKNPWDRPGFRESHAKIMTEVQASPEFRKSLSDAVRAAHARPEVRENQAMAQRGKALSQEHRAKISAADRARSPEDLARITAAAWVVDVKERRIRTAKERARTPEARAVRSRASKEVRSRPEVIAKMAAREFRPETRERIQAALRTFTDTHKTCKRHGLVPLAQCYEAKSRAGKRWRCNLCRLETGRRRRMNGLRK